MKLKVKGKRFFKELRNLYKEKRNSVSPECIHIAIDETKSPPTIPTAEDPPSGSPKRKVGKSSYRRTLHTKLDHPKKDASLCYKVLGIQSSPTSNKIRLVDTLTGKEYHTAMPNITKNGYAFETRQAAMSERLPSRIVGNRSHERLPRVVVSFECWGETRRRLGGGSGCNEFEYMRFMRIEQSLESPALHPLKTTRKPVPPHFYPNCDKSIYKKTRRNKKGSNDHCSSFRTALNTKEARTMVVFSNI